MEEDRISGTKATVSVKKISGERVTYRLFGYTLSSFIGSVDLLFEGTFKSKEGKTITVKKGECRFEQELPAGAEVISRTNI